MEQPNDIVIRRADYADVADAMAIVSMLDVYARDTAGGGAPLKEFARLNLVPELAKRSQAFSVIAWLGGDAVGLVNCFEGFSTFAARPLVNVHDVIVSPAHRGQGVAQRMLAEVERMARGRGACKLTLEVLQGNTSAMRVYERVGFAGYVLDPAMGQATFMQKWLD